VSRSDRGVTCLRFTQRWILAAALALVPGIGITHYAFFRAIPNPTSTTSTTTGTPSAPTVVTEWHCINAAGTTIAGGGPHATKAAAETPCVNAVSTATASATPTHFLEERVITTTTVPTTTTVRTRREEVFGSNEVKLGAAHAQVLSSMALGGSNSGGTSDGTPNAFSFVDQEGVTPSATVVSASVTISGIDTTVSCSATGGTLDVNSDEDFQASRNIVTGNTIRATHTASASNSTAVNTPVTCGGVSDTFTSTTTSGGALEHGELFTINGSGFGTHADNNVDGYTWKGHEHLHFRFSTFERGPAANTASAASWQTATNGFAPDQSYQLDDRVQIITGGPTPEGYFARRRFLGTGTNPRLGGLVTTFSGAPVGGPLYARYKQRISNSTANGKPWRIYYDSGGDIYVGASGSQLIIYREGSGCGQWFPGAAPQMQGFTLDAGNWHTFDMLYKQGATASRIQRDNVAVTVDNSSISATTEIPAMCAADDPNGGNIQFISMIDGYPDINGTDTHTRYYEFAEMVVDYTWARVLLGNASTYASSTAFEFQPAVTWSSTAIQIAINQGAFANLDDKYLYVLDTNNAVVNSSGIALE
jgi:hypothetical protein